MKRQHRILLLLSGLSVCGSANIAYADDVRPQRFTLVIHMSPAMCALDESKRNLRQCQEGFSLTIASLQPEIPAHSNEDCNVNSTPSLNPLQSRVVERVMPDEQLRREDWQRHGGCTGMSASTYFRTIANYAGRLRVPPEFNSAGEVSMQRAGLIRQLQSLNAGLPADGIQLRCVQNPRLNAAVLTEMRVCYNPRGQYVSCPSTVRSNCPTNFVVQGAP
jgi:ribonuclease T2